MRQADAGNAQRHGDPPVGSRQRRPPQLALAFCLGHPALANVLFGCTSCAQLRENLGALALWQGEGRRLVALVDEPKYRS